MSMPGAPGSTSTAARLRAFDVRALLAPRRARGARAAREPASLLAPVQITDLGVLLVAAQLPQAVHLPVWVAVFGFALVVLRFVQ